jgi:hypothetical protein
MLTYELHKSDKAGLPSWSALVMPKYRVSHLGMDIA